MSKAQLLAELQSEQAAWEALLNDIGEAKMIEPGVAGGWSIKDIIVHLIGWQKREVSRFQAALKHQPPPEPFWPSHLRTDDEINAWMVASNKDRSVSAILEEDRAVFRELVETLEAFPEEELLDPKRFDWFNEGETLGGAFFFSHFHDEHEPDIRAWLSKHQ
ncbi:ClbS/DfsB family four-helix bundle protein [Ktedonosporobacter rubrisoli]|nr:ClbS/DfsB family four-helix bundle protein [Ktedonosporobacter rubrisoli]